MRILHVLHTPRAEGTVRLTIDWLSEPGRTQGVMVLNSTPPELTSELKRRADWYQEHDDMPRGLAKICWITRCVRAACKRYLPDLVVCWANGFAPWVLSGARLAGVRKLITHAGNPPDMDLWGKVQTVVSTNVTRFVGGKMVCCSRYVASEFDRSPGACSSVLRVVHNCARLGSIADKSEAARRLRTEMRPTLIMVATLESHKDHSTLLRAMASVLVGVPDAVLVLAGDGTLRAELEGLCKTLGLERSVTFLGSRNDIPLLLGTADVFVFSTTGREGLGTVLIEAMAAHLPIVASDVPACREILEDGKWGTLVPAGSPEALANALIDALKKKGAPEAFGRQEFIRRFSASQMMVGYERAIAST